MSTPAFEPTDRPPEIGKFLVEVPLSFVANPEALASLEMRIWMKQNKGREADRQLTRRQHDARVTAPLDSLHLQGAVRYLNHSVTTVRILARQGLIGPRFEAAFRDPVVPTSFDALRSFLSERSPGDAAVTTLSATMRYLSDLTKVPMPAEASLRASEQFAKHPAIRDTGRLALAHQAPSSRGIRM